MAAAGLGNLISDVAGVGLAHYVEGVFYKMGIKHPVLSAEQLGSSRVSLEFCDVISLSNVESVTRSRFQMRICF